VDVTIRVECIARISCSLGEGPLWDAVGQRLFWIDIKAPCLFAMRLDALSPQRWPMPESLGAIGLRANGGLVGAFRSGFACIDLDTGSVTPIGDVTTHPPGNRFNDGHVDARGRFWAGTMDDGERRPSGHLYRLDADGHVERFNTGFVVTNGIEWSNDGRTLYFVESVERRIWSYDFYMDAGRPGERRVFAQLDSDAGYPDGLTVDADDHVWSVHWDGGRVTRYRPDGSVERVVVLPVPRPTSCCFGGPDLATLFVTSATIGLDAAACHAAPLSGGVFAITGLAVQGRLPHQFIG
jgi:sugar lactone lactonase YvrE